LRNCSTGYQPVTLETEHGLVARATSDHRATLLAIFAGVAQGLAFLSKTYPALIVTVIAVAAWLITRRISWRGLLLMIVTTVITIAPWTIYCLVRFAHEFVESNLRILGHLSENVENFAGPWDRVIVAHLL